MNKLLQLYRNAYEGLLPSVWMLALVTFVNRSGAMVLPFLSVYLTESLHYDLKETGIIISIYGIGSMTGSFAGGWLTDKFGHYKVQTLSLLLGGSLFFVVLWLKDYYYLAIGFFILSLVNESLRPANSYSVSYYSKPENVTRAFSLNRMAINLGFSIGPAIGGILAAYSYQLLFAADGITCIGAGILFYFYFKNRKGFEQKTEADSIENSPIKSPYQDSIFLLLMFANMGFMTVFFQLFTTLPLFYRDIHALPETQIGLLLGLNGLIVFLLEMILVYLLGNRKLQYIIPTGTVLVALSFLMLNFTTDKWILFASMLVLSVSEILVMPFLATVTVHRSSYSSRGRYMGLYSFSYAAAFVLAPFIGTRIIANFGYTTLWHSVAISATLFALLFLFLLLKMSKDSRQQQLVVSSET